MPILNDVQYTMKVEINNSRKDMQELQHLVGTGTGPSNVLTMVEKIYEYLQNMFNTLHIYKDMGVPLNDLEPDNLRGNYLRRMSGWCWLFNTPSIYGEDLTGSRLIPNGGKYPQVDLHSACRSIKCEAGDRAQNTAQSLHRPHLCPTLR